MCREFFLEVECAVLLKRLETTVLYVVYRTSILKFVLLLNKIDEKKLKKIKKEQLFSIKLDSIFIITNRKKNCRDLKFSKILLLAITRCDELFKVFYFFLSY